MSLLLLLDDQIAKLFEENRELALIKKNQFEIATAFFANLKYLHGIDADDLIDGILGDSGDEGIDHCYIFNNGVLVKDEDSHSINKESHIKLKIFQTKKENGFSTDGFRKLKEGIEEIFNLEKSLDDLKDIGANKDFIEKADLIRKVFRKAKKESGKFSCEVFYITAAIERKISSKIEDLKKSLINNPLNIPFDFYFLSAQDLIDLAGRYNEKIELQFNSQPLEIKERNIPTNGFCGFVTGEKLIESLIDQEGNFKSHLTEGNVRFFLGEDKKINSSIIETAKNPDKSVNFWAMNNGLTIIGESIDPLGNNQYSILNPQIVNGCQTVHCLYYAYKEKQSLPPSLKVFVKIINTKNIEIQTDIISATNSQNPVKGASLKANDNIQRNIEKHLLKYGIYYERRENYYKKQMGYTGNKVIGLLKMAQIMHTVINKEAVIAVNDITSIVFDNQTKYNSIFNETADFDIYVFSTVLYQKIWTLKNSDIRNNDYKEDESIIISRSGFILLHLMSVIILSECSINEAGVITQANLNKALDISKPERKSEFSKRKKQALAFLEDDIYLKNTYTRAKEILFKTIGKYVATGKTPYSIFKNRNFEKDFLKKEIDDYLQNNLRTKK